MPAPYLTLHSAYATPALQTCVKTHLTVHSRKKQHIEHMPLLGLDVWLVRHLDVVPGELDELLAVVQQLLVHELDEERAELEKPHPQALGIPPVAPEAMVNQLTHLFHIENTQ